MPFALRVAAFGFASTWSLYSRVASRGEPKAYHALQANAASSWAAAQASSAASWQGRA